MTNTTAPTRLWLDDVREAPAGWTRATTAREAIALLEAGRVFALSLDHDLGDETTCGSGYDVACWIEEAVATRGFEPPTIQIHSENVVGRERMQCAIENIERLVDCRIIAERRERARRQYERQYKPLLDRRVPRENVVVERAYVIHARNRGVGVAVRDDGRLGYVLHREKWGDHYLFTEWDWSEGEPFGTAIPLRLIEAAPPTNDKELLAWLARQEDEHRPEIDANWETILGKATMDRLKRRRYTRGGNE